VSHLVTSDEGTLQANMRTQRLETWSNLVSLGTRFQGEWSIGELWTGYSVSNMWQLKGLHPNI
jgi:hypothetical protein